MYRETQDVVICEARHLLRDSGEKTANVHDHGIGNKVLDVAINVAAIQAHRTHRTPCSSGAPFGRQLRHDGEKAAEAHNAVRSSTHTHNPKL